MSDDRPKGRRQPSAARESAPGLVAGTERSPGPGPALSRRERLYEAIDRRLPYLFLTPALLLVAGLVAYPAVWAVKLSLYEVQLVDLDAQQFVGLANYVAVLADPLFSGVLWNTVVFVGASVVGQVGIGLGLALLLDRARLADRLTRLYRLSFVLPWATTGVIVAFSWQFMFHSQVGLVNAVLRAVGVADPPTWLDSVTWAMVAVVVANVWRGVPFSLIFQTSGLRSIPGRLYEAADVGGASRLQTLRYVVGPLVRPFVAMNLLLVTLFTVNVFDIIYVMTGGGPLHETEVLSLHMYDTAFEAGRFGRANAIAVVLFGINLVVVGLYLRVFRRLPGVLR